MTAASFLVLASLLLSSQAAAFLQPTVFSRAVARFQAGKVSLRSAHGLSLAMQQIPSDAPGEVSKSQIRDACIAVKDRYRPEDTKRMDALLTPTPDEKGPTAVVADRALPDDLPGGAFMRVCPNPRPNSAISGLLDADGMVHCVVVPPAAERTSKQDGYYSHVWVRTSAFLKEEERGEEIFQGTISQAPRGWPMLASIVNNIVKGGQICKDSCNTALQSHGGRILALMEQALPSELRVGKDGSVRTERCLSDLDGAIPRDLSTGGALAAHARQDPNTGESLSITYNMNPPTARHDVFASDGRLAHQTTVPLPEAVMIHDLAITPEVSVILDLPLTFRAGRLLWDKFPIEYEAAGAARLGLLPRYGGAEEVEWFDVESCLCLHTINAFHRPDGHVVVQGMRLIPDGPDSYISKYTPAFPYQWVLDRESGTCVEERYLSAVPGEFPTVNPRVVGQAGRFAYAVRPASVGPVTKYGGKTEANLYSGLVQYDLQAGGFAAEYTLPPDVFFVSEATFVPKEGSAEEAEDSGYLSLFTSEVDGSGAHRGSSVMFFDAAALAQGPVSTIKLPSKLPYGLHSTFVPWDQLD